jgi:hypothetical protein
VYHVYEGPTTGTSLTGYQRGSTVTPDHALSRLPPNSTYLGQSEIAEGRIVIEKGFGIGGFFIILTAGVLGRLIYDRFFA